MVGKDSAKPQPPTKTVLSTKDNALFKSVVKFYTTKQYKKGIKVADSILKNSPNHGETLAMKGLILNCQDKKTEAYDYVRRGLKADLTSHVCWHTYGLLYRSDRNYAEAIKCYQNALRHDKDNLQILRDLSLLQIQMRDLEGYYDTRRKLLTLKPAQGNNWLAFAMSAHLLGNYDEGVMIIDLYDKSKSGESGFEYSEMLLYKNQMIEESGKYAAALDHLNTVESSIVDKLAWKEKRAYLFNLTGHYAEAEEAYRALIHLNPESQHYHRGLVASKLAVPVTEQYEQLCKKLTAEQQSALETLYSELAKAYPRSLLVRRVPLEFLSGQSFQAAFARYLCPGLRKGVPSLFTGLKALHSDEIKKSLIGTFINECIESLTKNGTFPVGEDGTKDTPADNEPPSSLLWALFFAAQHYDKLHNHAKAIELIDAAIAHTPTVIELYTLKAKVYKHAGDAIAAWTTYETARELDLADRYLNTKATLYALRANKVDVAERTISLFTKEGADSQDVLFDMQCMWYEIESAGAFYRLKDYGRCLKKLHAVDKHFADILEDQFDFHTYCLRKMTLRAYLSLLRLEDKLYALKFYRLAAKALVNTYLTMFDRPPAVDTGANEEGKALSAKERKKAEQALKNKQKQAKAGAAAATGTAATTTAASGSGSSSKPAAPASNRPADEDPHGAKLAAVAAPLEEASKFLRTLLSYTPDDVEVHILSCKVNLRRKKYLQVVQALNHAVKLSPDHPEVHQFKVELGLAVASLTGTDPVTVLIQEESSRLLNSKTPLQTNDEFVAKADTHNYQQRRVAAELLYKTNPTKKSEVLALLEDGKALSTAPLKEVIAAHSFISNNYDADLIEKFRTKSHTYFPLSTTFSPTPPPTTTPPPPQTTNDL